MNGSPRIVLTIILGPTATMKVVGFPSFVRYGRLNLKATVNLVVMDSPFLNNPNKGDRSIFLGGIHSGNCVGECLCNFGKEVEKPSGEGGGCVDDGPDAQAVQPAKDGSELHDDVEEGCVDFDGKDLVSWGIGGGQNLCVG
jgi:hypothetical protein